MSMYPDGIEVRKHSIKQVLVNIASLSTLTSQLSHNQGPCFCACGCFHTYFNWDSNYLLAYMNMNMNNVE